MMVVKPLTPESHTAECNVEDVEEEEERSFSARSVRVNIASMLLCFLGYIIYRLSVSLVIIPFFLTLGLIPCT